MSGASKIIYGLIVYADVATFLLNYYCTNLTLGLFGFYGLDWVQKNLKKITKAIFGLFCFFIRLGVVIEKLNVDYPMIRMKIYIKRYNDKNDKQVVYYILCKFSIDMLKKKMYLPTCLTIINITYLAMKAYLWMKNNLHKNLDAY